MFHPHYSSGTAYVKGDTSLKKNYHYYWEVKMLTDPYGTDIVSTHLTNADHNSIPRFSLEAFLFKYTPPKSYSLELLSIVLQKPLSKEGR